MKRLAAVMVLVTVMAICGVAPGGEGQMQASNDTQARLEKLALANIAGVHAYQVLLHRANSQGDPQCWSGGGLSDDALRALVARQASLLCEDAVEIDKWIRGLLSAFNPDADLAALLDAPLDMRDRLPVNVIAAHLSGAVDAPRADVLAIANLYQTALEVDRDGTILWDLMHFYRALGFMIYPGQLGLGGSDEQLLAVGGELARQACPSPFAGGAVEWQIAGRKVWNWGEKYLHVRDNYQMAREMLAQPDVRVLIPRIRAMAPRRIAVIGHSFTMQSHWSTPGSFAATVGAIFQMENPQVQYRQWGGGSLTPARAYNSFYGDALAWGPDVVLFVTLPRTEDDYARLREMAIGLRDAGARVAIFDNVRVPLASGEMETRLKALAAETGMDVIEVVDLIDGAPDGDSFLCLDGIHMTEPYHRLIAREWLGYLVGMRAPAL